MHCVSACDVHFDMLLYACISPWPCLVSSLSDSGVNHAWQVRSLIESPGPAMHGMPATKLIALTTTQYRLHH